MVLQPGVSISPVGSSGSSGGAGQRVVAQARCGGVATLGAAGQLVVAGLVGEIGPPAPVAGLGPDDRHVAGGQDPVQRVDHPAAERPAPRSSKA